MGEFIVVFGGGWLGLKVLCNLWGMFWLVLFECIVFEFLDGLSFIFNFFLFSFVKVDDREVFELWNFLGEKLGCCICRLNEVFWGNVLLGFCVNNFKLDVDICGSNGRVCWFYNFCECFFRVLVDWLNERFNRKEVGKFVFCGCDCCNNFFVILVCFWLVVFFYFLDLLVWFFIVNLDLVVL